MQQAFRENSRHCDCVLPLNLATNLPQSEYSTLVMLHTTFALFSNRLPDTTFPRVVLHEFAFAVLINQIKSESKARSA